MAGEVSRVTAVEETAAEMEVRTAVVEVALGMRPATAEAEAAFQQLKQELCPLLQLRLRRLRLRRRLSSILVLWPSACWRWL